MPADRFNIWWALAVSAVLHGLTVLLLFLLPIGGGATAAVEPREERVQFSFAPEPEPEPAPQPTPQPPVDPVPPPPEPPPDQAPPVISPPAPQQRVLPEVPQLPPPVPPEAGRETPAEPGAPSAESAPLPPAEPAIEQAQAAEPEPSPLAPALEQPAGAPPQTAERGIELPERGAEEFRAGRPGIEESQVALDQAFRRFEEAVGQAQENARRQARDRPQVFQPDLAALPPTGHTLGNLVFQTGDYDWAASGFDSMAYVAIWRAWHNRLLETVDAFERWAHVNQQALLRHQAVLRFTIERDGDVSGIELLTPSGCQPMDLSAFDALDEVVLPPIPKDFPKQRETVVVTFIMTGHIPNMRPGLRRLKAAGFF